MDPMKVASHVYLQHRWISDLGFLKVEAIDFVVEHFERLSRQELAGRPANSMGLLLHLCFASF